MPELRLPLLPDTPELAAPARAIAERWDFPLDDVAGAPYRLVLTAERLEARPADGSGVVYVDLVGGRQGFRRRQEGKGEAVVRAVGKVDGRRPTVIDATAGLGRDAAVLAAAGCAVLLVERSPVVSALLEDGIRRAAADPEAAPVAARMRVAGGVDALTVLARERAEVVYLDPMFPHRSKSASVKKEMSFLQAVAEPPEGADEAALLEAARRAASRRVVVKRPAGAPPLAGQQPSGAVPTRGHRFDIYPVSPG